MKTIRIDVVSDVMCPWCYIGKRRLEKAIEMLGEDVAVEVNWRPFQLDATLPKEGKDRRRYLEDKFGGSERAAEAYANVRRAGDLEAIPFDFDAITVSANTLDAHRMIRWAGEVGRVAQDRLVEILFRRYFTEGAQIGDDDVLADAAEEAGLDRTVIETKLRGDLDRQSVEAEIASAQRMGVQGVPCFILDGKYAVSGAQPADVLADAIHQVAGQKAA
ncbi:DsbA family oxidoreductase [Pararhizobium haloflavum]|uniref:DsbA family oxidoreductase n=1 Tax=Pararhizobium haloflavum TaxID=2037914 RepID=UPI000C1A6BB2|nr:DsbA family oxidoreductase [Pararhizobium haloflavum]